MSAQVSFISESQNSFLAALPAIAENQIITGFDSFIPNQFCTPSFLGCKLCIGANVVNGFLTLTFQASTPFGGVNKSFKITNNINFTWNRFGLFKVEVKIANFTRTGSSFSFKITVKICIKVPIWGWKCKSFSHTFSVPTVLPQAQQSFLSASADDDSVDDTNNVYGTMLMLQAILEDKSVCSCESDD